MPAPKPRKHLSFDALIDDIYNDAEGLPDHRSGNCGYSISDSVMSAIAMFSLKDPSLLKFQERRNDQNLKDIYRIKSIPSDTCMRDLLDPIKPDLLRPMFNTVFRNMQRSGELKPFEFLDGHYLLAVDGTEYFTSNKVHCDCCLERVHKNGETSYYHQMVGASLVHPDLAQVIPVAPEPIIKQDGESKNDCERNATKRLLTKFREEHPHLKVIVVEDGLSSNAPHIRLLKKLHMHFLLVAKPTDHKHLFEEVKQAQQEGLMTTMQWQEKDSAVTCEIQFSADFALNKSNSDVRVNFLQYCEYNAEGQRIKYHTWVTDLTITESNAPDLVKGGRSRWKIENEIFNTLKNQGYQFEHNFGHGQQNLSVVFAMLMMITFLIDQTQERCCPVFQAVRKKFSSRTSVWDWVRSHFRHFGFTSMQHLYEAIINDSCRNIPYPTLSFYGSRVT